MEQPLGRYRSLELLRGFGIAAMVFLHGALYQFGSLGSIDLAHPPVVVTLIGFLLMWGGLFAVLSGATHAIRSVQRLERGIPFALVRRWELSSGVGFIALGIVYFTLFGPSLLDIESGGRDNSVLVGLIREGRMLMPGASRLLYMNTLFMIGFSTLLVAPCFGLIASRREIRARRSVVAVACLACAALGSAWLRIPLYPLFQDAMAERRYGLALVTFWLVAKNDPMWPALGLTLSGSVLGLAITSRERVGRLRVPTWLGIGLIGCGVIGYAIGPDTMLERRIDGTWFAIMLLQAGVVLVGVTAAHRLLDREDAGHHAPGAIERALNRFSRASLSVLFGETIVAELAGRLLGWISPGWNRSFLTVVLFGVASMLFWAFALAAWERFAYRGSLDRGWVVVMNSIGRPSSRLEGLDTDR